MWHVPCAARTAFATGHRGTVTDAVRTAIAARLTSGSVPVKPLPAATAFQATRANIGKYITKTHEWLQVDEEGVATIGITQVAQRALGEIVYCRLPREGDSYRTMDTLVTLEALKRVGEVKSPLFGEVIQVNPRLRDEPGLVTHAPLTDGWLVRLSFSGTLPKYLLKSRAVPRADLEPILGDSAGLQRFLAARLGDPDSEGASLSELTLDSLNSIERSFVHRAAAAAGLATRSQGTGAGRQLVVMRPKPPGAEADGVGVHDGGEAPGELHADGGLSGPSRRRNAAGGRRGQR